jgi:hypothetical protein
MKNLLFLTILLATISCCKKKDKTIDDIVPITQSGANTFACLIDGEIASTQLYYNTLVTEGVEYGIGTAGGGADTTLSIYAITKNPRRDFTIRLKIKNKILNTHDANEFVISSFSHFNNSGGSAPIGSNYYEAIDSLPASVTLTKYTGSIINGNSKGDILSGTFDMILQNSAGAKIHLTQGRFDIKTQ